MMMVEKEDLGLSLSLSFGVSCSNQSSLQLNLMPCSSSPSPSPFGVINKASWTDAFTSSGHGDGRCFMKGIDVNCSPEVEVEEEGGVSSPNSTISSVSGKRSSEREDQASISDEEDAENSRKKLRLSKDQSALLEQTFKDHNTLNPKQKMGLAKRLGLRPRQVEVWFQNRRARTKLKQTEVDCEFLKRWSENLREENRRLQKEVQELRALKLSPHLYMQMTPPTTLTICPSCDRSVALPAHPRPLTFTPWSAAPTPIPHCRPFDLLHSHSHSHSRS